MKKGIIKTLASALAFALFISLLAGCGASSPAGTSSAATATQTAAEQTTAATTAATEAAANDSATTAENNNASGNGALDPVKLTFYCLGDGSVDDPEVINAINERTSELINTTIDRKLISWADFNTKYSLIFAAGEEFDMIFTATWSYYAQQAVKGGFHEITMEMLEQYAPNIYANVPEDAWKQARIGGKIYMLPNNQEEYSGFTTILIRGDLRKKYNVPELTSLENVELYLDAIAQNEPGIIPLDGGAEVDKWVVSALWFSQPNNYGGAAVPGYVYKLDDPEGTMINKVDLPEYREFLTKMVEFNARGYWSKNALNNEIRTDDGFKNGKSATAMHNFETMINAAKVVEKSHPEWEPEIYDATFGQYQVFRTSYLGNGVGVHITSKNLERSLMWVDTIRFDRECYDLMMYGIEGKHWIDEGPGLYKAGPNIGDYGSYSIWAFTTDQSRRKDVEDWPTKQAVMDSYKLRAVKTAPPYFMYDDTNYKNEVAAMTEITDKYSKIFDFGFDVNWEQLILDVERQYEAAGRSAVLEDAQKQLTEFITEYSK